MRAAWSVRGRAPLTTPRRERGSVAVEFALIVPILTMLLLGITTAGITYSHGIAVANAVREGARFGATGDATVPGTWAGDLITRVRAMEFDDTGNTAVCVQLWKGTAAAGSAVPNSTMCDQGTYDAPALSTADASFPAVPSSGLTSAACVVRVLAARKYVITLGVFPSLSGTLKRGSVARYERTC